LVAFRVHLNRGARQRTLRHTVRQQGENKKSALIAHFQDIHLRELELIAKPMALAARSRYYTVPSKSNCRHRIEVL
jgi:hypothetical protein